MARVTVEDCLENEENRFALVLLATRRTRQLLKGAPTLVDHHKNKAPVLALREIAAGKVRFDRDPSEVMAVSTEELKAKYGDPRAQDDEGGSPPIPGSPQLFG